MELKNPRMLTGLTQVISLFLALASYYGAFVPNTYIRDSASMGAQGMGQDIFDLFAVVPLLLLTLTVTLRGNLIAFWVLAGTLFYVLYSYVIYAFGVHFNRLFLVYCTIVGTSLYAFLLCVIELNKLQIQRWFDDRVPMRGTGIYFIAVAVLFYLLWFKDVIPAILGNSVPASVADNNLLVNPVHVLDIAIVLPGLIITAILLFKKHPLCYIFTPIYLIFTILLALALIAMFVALMQKGIVEDISITAIFIVLAMISSVFLYQFFQAIKS